ncbi:RtcB family protein [Spirochaeta isovalerica]|uniref:3'-phosphate/5'-hydroxy nucleic acid ligase n=1 Tax=Spirochaeta isovalerica TaxID=150 RepID=A0A841RAH3_9SPIO|nr:RtcB family protein [Spirochaeta isovalerica]MBB6482384.1 tRNA-splicing ligase RtcB [Spirochaeta isovalerica]
MEKILDPQWRLPVKSWCSSIEDSAMSQIANLAGHPALFKHIAIMPDCHSGYGMPIGGVIASESYVVPNAVGVDIGCGMGAVETDLNLSDIQDNRTIRSLLDAVKASVPVGEGHAHREEKGWEGFEAFLESIPDSPGWFSPAVWSLAKRNLGTLGGGNHFIELQHDENNRIWLMLHSGSRNLGYKIAEFYNNLAREKETRPDDLAYLSADSPGGKAYIRDMVFAMAYAAENRSRMMTAFKESLLDLFPGAAFIREINIHHNFAAREKHFGKDVWIHRKGATSAAGGEMGIIPGSMGTASYIVRGLGNPESFMSCSHGAGRIMSRTKACRELSVDECNAAMGDIVFDRWRMVGKGNRKNRHMLDLGESPLAYKNIDDVIDAQRDLVEPVVKLKPLGVIKG